MDINKDKEIQGWSFLFIRSGLEQIKKTVQAEVCFGPQFNE
jgi:hypothetical protein